MTRPSSTCLASRVALVVFALACAAPGSLAAQSGWGTDSTDWPSPPQPTGHYVRLGGSFTRFDRGLQLERAPGVDVALGTGVRRRFGAALEYGYTNTRSLSFNQLTPGQGVGSHTLALTLKPRLWRWDGGTALVGSLGGGLQTWTRRGAPGIDPNAAISRWLLTGGLEWRRPLSARITAVLAGRDVFTPIKAGEFTGGFGGRTGNGHNLSLGLGLAFHEAPFTVEPFSIHRLQRADRPVDPTDTPLVTSVQRVIGHVDGQAPVGGAAASAPYTGPQRLTLFFDAKRDIAVAATDIPSLQRIAKLLAETPGTIVVLRGWDVGTEIVQDAIRTSEMRAGAVRDVILAAAPSVNPQRISVVAVGPDMARPKDPRARRVELEYLRP